MVESSRTWTSDLVVEHGKIMELARATRTRVNEYGTGTAPAEHLLAPPTYPAVINHWGFSGTEVLESLGCRMEKILHGEESFEYPDGPLHEGQRLHGVMRLVDRKQKDGSDGPMTLLIFETEFVDTNTRRVVARVGRTIIERA